MASRKAFISRDMQAYKKWLIITTLLGIAFVFMQYIGFKQLWSNGITLSKNVSFSFLYILVGLHAVHVIGGVVALIIMWVKSLNQKIKTYSKIPVELINTYWQFVDFLWVYLLIFLLLIR
jgi:cytochrome c oxidase subunit 3